MRYIGFIFALCLSIQAIASNTITLSSVSGTPQTEVEVVVSLDNTDAITALELNIPLGEHLSYVDGSTVLASSRSNGHLLTATQVHQELRICVYSLNLSALQGNSGELLSFRLKLGNEPATYTLTPSVILSDTRGQSLDSYVQSGQVSILAPKLEILNPQIDYGHIPIRETYTQDLQLYNAGNLPLIIDDIVVNDPAFTPALTALTIEVGEVAYTTIHYTPTVRGAIQKEVVVTSNAINGKQMGTIVADPFSVNELHVVGGSGIADNAVTISLKMNNMEPIVGMQCTFVLPEQLEYIAGSLSANSSRSNGHQALASVKKFVEKENQWYDSKGDTLVLMLYSMANQPLNGDDGEIATFQVRLNGNSGSYALTPRDVVLTNATAENMVSATYEGWVEIQSPQFSGDDYLSFGDWSITDDIVANYVVRNDGDAPLEIERVTFLAQGYRVVSTMPLQINPWEESTMQIAYDPAAEGDFSTTMNIYTNDPTTRMKAVAVSGHVYEPNTLSMEGERMQDGSYQLAISLDNYTNIVGVQYDIHWRSDMTTSQAAFTPTARLQNHTYAIMPIGQNTYRVLIYSLTNTPITGKEGELHQLLFTPQGDVDYCGDVLTIDNIVLSNASGTDKVSQSTVLHHLPTTQYSEQTITACDQYAYNNKVYQSSGTYIDTLQTVGGCDSIVTTYLTINHSEREEYYETACEEFWWHDNRYTESGDYTYHTTAWNGCERVEILHLTINKRDTIHYNEVACDEFYWERDGSTYYESGDYVRYTTTEQGCERVEILHLTINHSEREEYWETACDEYWWHDNQYTESGDYEYYTTTEQGCERVEVLHLTINHPEYEEYYVTVCKSYEWHGEVYREAGDYTYETTTTHGCQRTEVLHLTLSEIEHEEFTVSTCEEYWWHDTQYTESGDYEYHTTTDEGCERLEILHLTINHNEREEFNVSACESYEWHGNTYYSSGTYEHYTTTDAGCERVEVLHLTIHHSEYEEYYVTVCDSYEWHGEVYREAGDYTYETTTAHGCPRTEVLHLTLSDSEYEEYWETACDSYEWHGEVYTESSDYEYRTTTEQGCERVEVLHLTINRSEREEYWETACDSYEWHGQVYTESGDYEYRTNATEQLYVGYNSQNDPIVGLTPPRGISRFTVDGYITQGAGTCFVGTGTPADEVADEADLRIFAVGCLYYDRMSGRNSCFFDNFYNPFNIEFGNYYARNVETGEYYFKSEEVYEYSNTEHPITLFQNDFGKIHKVQFFDNNNLLWADINAVVENGVPMIKIDYYEADGTIYQTQQFTEHLSAETITTCGRVEVLHLTINRSEREEFEVSACDSYEWHSNTYYESGTYEYHTTTGDGCERLEVLHLTINKSEREEYWATACDEYYWDRNGNTYYSSGDYEHYTTTEQGCERVEILHLTINYSEHQEYYENACDAYEWHGNTYTESGDYEYRTTLENGCERVEVLHLTINRSEREEYNVTACDQYEWHGEVYTESGTYEYRTTLENGCQRVEVLHLTINRSEREEYWETACDEYFWDRDGNTYYDSGDYEHYTTTEHGCERVEILHLTINRSEYEDYWERACDQYEWHGEVYTASGDYEYRTTTADGCERVEVLHLTIYHSEYEDYWVTACDEYWWNNNQYTESGDYTYSFVRVDWGSGYCERTEVLHLTINKSEREEYWATACDEYYWDRNGNTYYHSGDYEHYTTTEHGCERVEVLHLTINRSEREEYWEYACDTYEWHGETYTQSGNYEYRSTLENGCERVEVLHLTIYNSQYEEYYETACDEYWWNGNQYTESGDYTYSYPLYNWGTGTCDRTEVLHLTINKRDTVHYYETACDEYWWNPYGYYYNTSGDYEHYTTNDQGCERVEILHLTINRSEREEYYETACDEYWWHDNQYTESGDYEYRTTLENGCERVEILHLTINHSQYEEYNITTCEQYEWHGETYTESGDYEYRTTLENGCERVEVLHLTLSDSEREEYNITACDSYEWHGETYTESGDYEYRTTIEETTEKLYVGYDAQNDPIIGLTPPRGISRFTVDGFITAGSGCCFVGTGSPENGIVDPEGSLRIFDAGCFYYDRMSGRNYCFFYDFREPFNIEFGNYYAKNLETSEYYFNEGNNVYEYSNTEYPLTLFYNDYGKIHKVQFFDNNNLLWADINAVIEGGVPMITIDYYNPDGSIYHTQQFTENLHAETKTITEQGCERVEVLHLTINHSEREEYYEYACDSYEWHGEVYTASGDYEYRTTLENGCERVEVLHLTIYNSQFEEYWETACDAYGWWGNTYTESGDYTYSYVIVDWGSGYCERTEVLHLTINKSEREEYWATACDEYYWDRNGNTYYSSGDYEHYTTTEHGCERVEVLHLTINRSEREEYWETACDSYEWHGQVYTESGDYEYRTTTAEGCERLEVLHLTINRSEYEEYYETACDEYWWWRDGNTYYESGTYEHYTTTEQGCLRVEVLHLTINKSEREEYWATACDEYYWDRNGNTYYYSGDYEHYTTTEQGCERVEVLHLTINRSEREEYWEMACDQYEWHGQVYTASGDYEYRTTLENGCERVEVLHLTIYNSQYEEYWETACDAYGWWGNTYTESGDYTYSYVIVDWGSGYCERTEVLHLTINKSEREEYWATACDEYYWDRNGNTYYSSGDYEHYTTTEHGCERVEVLHLTINHSEHQDYYENACDAYEWHGQVYTESGDYEYRSTLENGCERVEVLHLTIYNSQYEEYWETACDAYGWWGNTYTESGDYTYSYPLYNWGTGTCDRTEVLHLTINKRDTVHYYETACDEYWWNPYGYYYNTSGDYEHYTTNEYGCERVEVLHLTINRSEHQEYYENACDAYEWYGNTYTESGDYEYRSTLENGCERIEVLHLTIYNSQYEEYWETACDEYWWNGNQYTESGDYTNSYVIADWGSGYCERTEVLHLTILPDATTETEELALCPSELPYDWFGQSIIEAGTYSATEPYVGMECDSVIHELTLNVYVQTLPAAVTLPIVRMGEAIDVTIPTAEIQAHIAAETWYAPNALVAWYIMENSDWAALSADLVAVGITEVTLKYAVETDCGNVESDKMVIAVETTGLENIPTDVMGVYKVLRDNKIFIIRGGKAYSIMGHLVGDKSVIDPAVTIQ